MTTQRILETVYEALFAFLQTASYAGNVTVATFSRAVEPPDQVPVADQPALYQMPGPMLAEQRQLFGSLYVTKWTFSALVVFYLRADGDQTGEGTLPATIANYLILGAVWIVQDGGPGEEGDVGGLG